MARTARLDPVDLARAVVEAHHRLAAQGDAAHGHSDDEHKALDDGGAGNEDVALPRTAESLKHRVQHDQQDAVGGDGQEGRQTEQKHPLHNAAVESAPAKPDGDFFAQQGEQHEQTGGRLGDHRGPGRARHIQMEHENEEGVQHDIQRRPQHDGGHAQAGEALADQKAVHAGGQQAKKVPQV